MYRSIDAVPSRAPRAADRKSTRLNSSHSQISYAVFCLKQKNTRLNSSHSQISYAVFCLKKKITRLKEILHPEKVFLAEDDDEHKKDRVLVADSLGYDDR